MEAVGFGLFMLFWFAFVFGGLGFWIYSLVEIVKLPEHAYRLAGKEKLTWVLIVALVSWVGALIWWFGPRRDVKAAFAANPALPPMGPIAYGPPPGWYPDPSGAPGTVWWDGARWTGHRQ